MAVEDATEVGPVEADGLAFGCVLDGQGGARLVDWQGVEEWDETDGPLWVHLDRHAPRVETWLREKSGLTEATINALLAEETRPRVFRGKRGLIAILRGVNTNPGAEPEDMVDMRLWSDGKKVISLRHRRLMTPRDLLAQLIESENGPRSASQVFERLIGRLAERMAGTIESYEKVLDDLEEDIDIAHATRIRRELAELRRDTVTLRRYMAPQREALGNLLIEPPPWLEDSCRINLRETADRLMRYLELLDAARERSIVIKDDIANQLAEASNRTLYVLAIISAIFLPLAFLTGLLGINIGGMPGLDNPSAFWIACGVMVVMLAIELIVFRWLKWL